MEITENKINGTMGVRISLPDKDGMDADQQRVFDQIVKGRRGELVGPLRAALHNPSLAERWSHLGETLRFTTRLPNRLSELAILITARHWNSQLEWTIHRRAAKEAGLEDETVDAIRNGIVPDFENDEDKEVHAFVGQMLRTGAVDDAPYAAVRNRWDEGGVVELTALVGYYCMVALTLNVHRIPLPDGVAPDLDPVTSPSE